MRQLPRHPETRPQPPAGGLRPAFTLIELLVVIGIMVVLTIMTIGTINLSVTSERVRSGARQIQSLVEGSRDRAIYAQEARGIRILVNEQITEDHDGMPGTPEIATTAATIVYIGSPGQDTSEADVDDVDNNANRDEPLPNGPLIGILDPTEVPSERMYLIGVGTRFKSLAENGLIGPGSRIRIHPDKLSEARNSTEVLTIHPRSFPVETESMKPELTAIVAGGDVNGNDGGGPGMDEVLILTYPSELATNHLNGLTSSPPFLPRWHFAIETNADVLPGEEPSVLPRNVCLDLETSHLPSRWVTTVGSGVGAYKQYSNRMDLLFSPNGAIVGEEGSAGLIHLHLCDVGDAIINVPPGSQTIDGTPMGEPRNGDEFGITIFTKSGRVIVHPIDWASYPVPGSEFRNLGFVDAMDLDGNPNTLGFWQPNTTYTAGNIVAPRLYNGNIYRATASSTGSSGSITPTMPGPNWNLQPGGLTQDGGVEWFTIKHNVWQLGVEGELAR